MINREQLDRLMPWGHDLRRTANRLTGIATYENFFVEESLNWIATFSEENGPGQRAIPRFPGRWIRIDGGLTYKTSGMYMTHEGWPQGTTCWFAVVECGFRWYVAGDAVGVAVLRIVVFLAVLRKWIDSGSSDPEEVLRMIEREMAR